jgi:preprotein translocase subunit SecY
MRECHLMMVMVVVVVIVLMTRRRRRIGIHSNGNVHNIDLW